MDAQKKMKKYINSVERKLNMPRDIKKRVMNDFVSSIQARREAGQTDEALYLELGAPKQAAAELNEQMKAYTYVKSPWRWVCLALVILCAIWLANGGTTYVLLSLPNASINHDVGIIGGADGPTAVFITTSGDFPLYQTLMTVLLLIMGIIGFYRLNRCPRK